MFELTVWHVIVPNRPVKTFYLSGDALFAFNAAKTIGLNVTMTTETKIVTEETYNLYQLFRN